MTETPHGIIYRNFMIHISPTKRPSRRRFLPHGLLASALLHSVAIAACVAMWIQPWWSQAYQLREARAIRVVMTEQRTDPPDPAAPEVRIVSVPDEVRGDMIRDRLDEMAEANEQLSDQEKLAKLDRLTDRLSDVSSGQSIDRMSDRMHQLLGTTPRADRPADEPVAGDFDFDSAQFHDVQRMPREEEEEREGETAAVDEQLGEADQWRYIAILLDAEGRTIEVELDAVQGEQLYLTMQRIESNPLLEKVYRQIAMPLFDQMLSGLRQASRATDQLQQSAAEQDQASADQSTDKETNNEPSAAPADDPFADPR